MVKVRDIDACWYVEMGHMPINVCFVFSERAYLREMKRLGIPADIAGVWLLDGTVGTTTTLRHNDKHYCFIAISLDGGTPAQIRGTIVHESVHAWQNAEAIMRAMGKCGLEIPAYNIQGIAQYGMRVYDRLAPQGKTKAGVARKKRAK